MQIHELDVPHIQAILEHFHPTESHVFLAFLLLLIISYLKSKLILKDESHPFINHDENDSS